MIAFIMITILGQPNFILNFEEGYDKTLKNIQYVSEDQLRIDWK